MNRGVTNLTNAQLKIASDNVKDSPHTDQLLIGRLTPNDQNGNLIQVELSEDQAEIIMDSLPMPNENEDPNLTSLRQNMQQFLTNLRFPDQIDKKTTI